MAKAHDDATSAHGRARRHFLRTSGVLTTTLAAAGSAGAGALAAPPADDAAATVPAGATKPVALDGNGHGNRLTRE